MSALTRPLTPDEVTAIKHIIAVWEKRQEPPTSMSIGRRLKPNACPQWQARYALQVLRSLAEAGRIHIHEKRGHDRRLRYALLADHKGRPMEMRFILAHVEAA